MQPALHWGGDQGQALFPPWFRYLALSSPTWPRCGLMARLPTASGPVILKLPLMPPLASPVSASESPFGPGPTADSHSSTPKASAALPLPHCRSDSAGAAAAMKGEWKYRQGARAPFAGASSAETAGGHWRPWLPAGSSGWAMPTTACR